MEFKEEENLIKAYENLIKKQLDFICDSDDGLDDLRDESADQVASAKSIINFFQGNDRKGKINEVLYSFRYQSLKDCIDKIGMEKTIDLLFSFKWWVGKDLSERLYDYFESFFESNFSI